MLPDEAGEGACVERLGDRQDLESHFAGRLTPLVPHTCAQVSAFQPLTTVARAVRLHRIAEEFLSTRPIFTVLHAGSRLAWWSITGYL